MKLERLSKDNQALVESKNVYFVGFSSSYIDYFFDCFPKCIEKLCGVFALLEIDDRTQRTVNIKGKSFDIRDLCKVTTLDKTKDIIIIMYEYENEAYDKLSMLKGIDDNIIFWFPDKASEFEIDYREKYRDDKLEDIILFRSGPRHYVYGDDFTDNSRALFEYMVLNGYNKKWKLVWLVNEPDNKDYDEWKMNDNVVFIGLKDKESEDDRKRELYYRYLCLSKFAFVTDDEIFFRRRRKDQTLIQLWHGDGVKGRTRFRRMEKRFDYMVCTSRFFANVDYKDFGLRYDQMISCGCPKDDWVLSNEKKSFIFDDNKETFSHYILWAPTFRKTVKGMEMVSEKTTIYQTGLPILNSWEKCDAMNGVLKACNCLMIIKLHPIADLSIYEDRKYSNIRLITNQELYSYGLHINQIMSSFDAFITDYSSAATSYMILDRPMAFTLDDLNEFDESRGFVLTPVRDYLSGKELYSTNDMKAFVNEVCDGKDTSAIKRRRLIEKMLDYRDINSSKRVLSKFMIDK